MQLTERGLRFFERGVAKQIENASLLIAKERADGDRRFVEFVIEHADDGGDAARLERVVEIAFHLLVVRRAACRAHAACQLRFAEVEDAEFVRLLFVSDDRLHSDRSDGHAGAAGAIDVEVVSCDAIAVDVGVILEVVEERRDGVVRGDASKIEPRRRHFALVDVFRRSARGNVAARIGEPDQQVMLERLIRVSLGQLDHARCIVQDLNRFDAGDVVEEPAA